MNKLLILIFSAFASAAAAQATPPSRGGQFSDVAFITGKWYAAPGDGSVDAAWSDVRADNITGYVRVVKGNQVTLYELFAFEKTEQGLAVFVKHFRPGLLGVEEKDKPDRYLFMEAGPGFALFEKQGQEMRVRYERRGADQFAIVIGRPQEGEWTFRDFWVFNRAN